MTGRLSHGGGQLVRLIAIVLLIAACGASPTASPTPAYMLARVNAEDADHPDRSTDRAVAEAEFGRILDCAVEAYGSAETERSAADTIYRGWVASGKATTLLEWAQVLC